MATTTSTTPMDDSVMGKLLEEHEELAFVPHVGEIITGSIMEKARNAMYIDLGSMGVGVIYGKELFDDLDTHKNAKIGDTVQATVQAVDNEEGCVELSLRSATRERSWDELRRKLDDGDIFLTDIIEANKGGLIVRVNGVTGFLPVSQLAPDHYPRVEGGDKSQILERLKSYVGEPFKVKVITADQEEEKLVVSEKAAVGDEISEILKDLSDDKVVDGVISGVVDFGVFVKFEKDNNELEGLVHISELAWQRIDDPADLFTVGDKVQAKVIGVDGLRISLSIKQLQEDPWTKVGEKYSVGDKVQGEVLKVTPFGGFVRLDKDIHGLIHISELPEDAQKNPDQVLQAGETRDFYIISMDPGEHRLGLSFTKGGTKTEKEGTAKDEKESEDAPKKTAKKKVAKKKSEKEAAEDTE